MSADPAIDEAIPMLESAFGFYRALVRRSADA